MLQWILVAILVALVFGRRHLIGDLVRTVRRLPKDFAGGKAHAEDPVGEAKDITQKK